MPALSNVGWAKVAGLFMMTVGEYSELMNEVRIKHSNLMHCVCYLIMLL